MSKYIGFDIDCKKVVACVVEKGKRDIYETMGPDVGSMREFLLAQKQSGKRVSHWFRPRYAEWELSAVLSLMCRLPVSTNRSLGCQPD